MPILNQNPGPNLGRFRGRFFSPDLDWILSPIPSPFPRPELGVVFGTDSDQFPGAILEPNSSPFLALENLGPAKSRLRSLAKAT